MKILLATAALAVVVSAVSPASAQSYGQSYEPGQSAYAQSRGQSDESGFRAFAQSEQAPFTVQQRRNLARARMQTPDGRAHSPNPAYDVYDGEGHYISSDPDPFIRNDLVRTPPD